MPDLLSLPNEILVLIFNEVVRLSLPLLFLNTGTVQYISRCHRASLKILPVVLTCRQFRELATPLLYTYCLLQYRITMTDDLEFYSWSSTNPQVRGLSKCYRYRRYGETMKVLCFNQETHSPICAGRIDDPVLPLVGLLGPLFPIFNNLKEARFHANPYLVSLSQVQQYTDGIQNVLRTCLSLKKLLLEIKACVVVCRTLRSIRRYQAKDQQAVSSIDIPHAKLDELHLDCMGLWLIVSADEYYDKREAAFSVPELFCDIIWPAAATVKTFCFAHNSRKTGRSDWGAWSNLKPHLLAKYELSMLEKVSVETDELNLAVFDAFFAFDGAKLKSLEIRDIYSIRKRSKDGGHGELHDTLDLDFILRYPNLQHVSIRDLVYIWHKPDRIYWLIDKIFSMRKLRLTLLKDIEYYSPPHDVRMVEAMKEYYINRTCVVTAPESYEGYDDGDEVQFGAHFAFPLLED